MIYLATKGAAGRLADGKQCTQSAAEDTIRPLDAVTHSNGRQVEEEESMQVTIRTPGAG